MKKFLVLYYAPKSAMEQMEGASEEQAKKGMDMWMEWSKKVGDKMVDLGAPLGAATKVGAGTKTSNLHLGGYTILSADSSEEAEKLMDNHPHLMLEGAEIEIHECLPM